MEPVRVAGSLVQRATLHNEDFVNDKDLKEIAENSDMMIFHYYDFKNSQGFLDKYFNKRDLDKSGFIEGEEIKKMIQGMFKKQMKEWGLEEGKEGYEEKLNSLKKYSCKKMMKTRMEKSAKKNYKNLYLTKWLLNLKNKSKSI